MPMLSKVRVPRGVQAARFQRWHQRFPQHAQMARFCSSAAAPPKEEEKVRRLQSCHLMGDSESLPVQKPPAPNPLEQGLALAPGLLAAAVVMKVMQASHAKVPQ